MPRIPERLKEDAVIEAVLEIRFDSTEAIPEITVGRLADRLEWKNFRRHRLPISELPEQIRLSDPNLRVQPIIELVAPDGIRTVKIGTNVLSFHNTKRYLGWDAALKNELNSTVEFLFSKVDGIKVRRIGLRYINGLTEEKHFVKSAASDLNIGITLKDKPLTGPFNLNFIVDNGKLVTVTRIATKGMVQGDIPVNLSAYIDIDTSTQDGFISENKDEVNQIIEDAHTVLKTAFFDLLPEKVIKRLEDAT
jgi:uncharacterized protein (TIGR04255 family)